MVRLTVSPRIAPGKPQFLTVSHIPVTYESMPDSETGDADHGPRAGLGHLSDIKVDERHIAGLLANSETGKEKEPPIGPRSGH